MHVSDYLVLLAPLLAAVLLAVFLIRNRWRFRFPLFTIYVLYSVVNMSLRLAVMTNYQLYFKVYWVTEAGDVFFVLIAAYESFADALRAMFTVGWFRLLLPTLAMIVLIYSGWKAVARPPAEADTTVALIVGLEVTSQYLIAGTFLVFASLCRFLGFTHVRSQFAVISGFGVASLGTLAATLVRSEFGTRFPLMIRWSSSVAYMIALIIWLVRFHTPWRVGQDEEQFDGQITSDSALEELRRYGALFRRARK